MAVDDVAIAVSVVNCTWSEHSFLPSVEGHCRSHALVDSLRIAAVVIAVRNLGSYHDLRMLMGSSSLSSRWLLLLTFIIAIQQCSLSNSTQLGRKSPAMTVNC